MVVKIRSAVSDQCRVRLVVRTAASEAANGGSSPLPGTNHSLGPKWRVNATGGLPNTGECASRASIQSYHGASTPWGSAFR